MAAQYCILSFPNLTGRSQIDRYREQFDPLAPKLAPHVTLVFPFESTTLQSDTLARHVARKIRNAAPFDISLSLPAVLNEGYVYLRISAGASQLRHLHDSLYTGNLHSFLRPERHYVPHITIGRYTDEQSESTARQALAQLSGPFHGRIHEVILERIAPDESSLIVARLPL